MNRRERKVVRDGYDRIASTYLEARPHDGEDVALLEELLSQLSNASRVLDAGCGSGVPVSSRLLDGGHDVIGVDFSSGQLSLARTVLAEGHLVQGDLTELPFADESFDAVVSFYAIIHVPRQEHDPLLREIHRVLRTDGLTLLCLGWGDQPEDHDPDSWLGVPMFWSHFDGPANLALLSEVGFIPEWSRRIADPMGHASHQFVLARHG
jgi:ubiquinone/menaquinone biosynthesis C-methylase UbiE